MNFVSALFLKACSSNVIDIRRIALTMLVDIVSSIRPNPTRPTSWSTAIQLIPLAHATMTEMNAIDIHCRIEPSIDQALFRPFTGSVTILLPTNPMVTKYNAITVERTMIDMIAGVATIATGTVESVRIGNTEARLEARSTIRRVTTIVAMRKTHQHATPVSSAIARGGMYMSVKNLMMSGRQHAPRMLAENVSARRSSGSIAVVYAHGRRLNTDPIQRV